MKYYYKYFIVVFLHNYKKRKKKKKTTSQITGPCKSVEEKSFATVLRHTGQVDNGRRSIISREKFITTRGRRKVAESKIPVDKTVKIYLELDASRKLEEKYSWLINVEIVAIPITN